MKIRFTSLLCLLASVSLMLSCGESDDAPASGASSVITFGATAVGSRASTLVGNESAMRSNPFGLFGEWSDDNQPIETVFDDVKVAYDDNAPSGWKYSPTKYWAATGSYKFRAYWPATIPAELTSNARSLALKYNMTTHDDDLMVAYKECSTKSPSVNLNFRHALAAVAVKFETNVTDCEYRVKNVHFTGLYYTGTLAFNEEYDETKGETPNLTTAWIYADRSGVGNDVRLREWKDDVGREIPQSAADYPEEFNLFIPQSLKVGAEVASVPAITLTFEIIDSGSRYEGTATVPLPATDKNGNEMVWQAGKKYVYVISNNISDFNITVNTSEWDDVNASVGDIEF